jgi:hypothetical protein
MAAQGERAEFQAGAAEAAGPLVMGFRLVLAVMAGAAKRGLFR